MIGAFPDATFDRMMRRMATVDLFRFEAYDINADKMVASKRWGTLEGISRVNGIPIMTSRHTVDELGVEFELQGLTRAGYIPPKR
jgi:hypothetical protein